MCVFDLFFLSTVVALSILPLDNFLNVPHFLLQYFRGTMTSVRQNCGLGIWVCFLPCFSTYKTTHPIELDEVSTLTLPLQSVMCHTQLDPIPVYGQSKQSIQRFLTLGKINNKDCCAERKRISQNEPLFLSN